MSTTDDTTDSTTDSGSRKSYDQSNEWILTAFNKIQAQGRAPQTDDQEDN